MPTAVVTGGAGFVGSHLCERLLAEGWNVVAVDSMLTGDEVNLAACAADPRFELRRADVNEGIPVEGPVDAILHLASPASPTDYLEYPLETLRVGSVGTLQALEAARRSGATFLLASTSEVYGDPTEHPQPETYWGNVNPVGPRSVYDEAKRFAEAAASAYARTNGMPVRIARIFNTYGPRMRRRDGRAVPTFLAQALRGEPLTVHGDGSQIRSLCYVDDLVEGLWRLLRSDLEGPVNLGNPQEITIRDLSDAVARAVGVDVPVVLTERPVDDPQVRCPDITRARTELRWEPLVPLAEGLARTVGWARAAWAPELSEEPASRP